MAAAPAAIPRVLVTGASGFLACHVIQKLLQGGEYLVRGTVRDLKNENKLKPIKELHPDAKLPIELVEGSLTDKECWISAVQECTYVIHVASPFPASNPKDENEVIGPAIAGTLNVLEACAKSSCVKRVVLTSSIASIYAGHIGSETPLTEDSWSELDHCSPYEKSKTLAEKAAWEFMEKLPENEKFELTAINPTFIMGPILSASTCTSMEVPRRLLQREMPMIPKLMLGVCDVRNVAEAHINAMTCSQAPGRRFIINSSSLWLSDMARILDEEFRPKGYKVPTWTLPYVGLVVASWFDPSLKMILPNVGLQWYANNDRMKTELKVEPRDVKESILDMAYSMIDKGFVKKTSNYTPRNT